MEDFRRVMDLFGGYRISSFPYQDLFKFYTWLKSHELISHWMQTNLDGQDDKHVAQFINAYLQSLVTKNEKEALLCEMEYLYQLTGPPKKKFFLIDGFLRNISNLSPGKTERRSYRSQALKYLWKFLRPLANSYYGGEKEYAVVLLRLREAYSYELLRNDMYSEAKAFENEVFGSLQAYCSEFRSTDIEIYEFSIFRSAHFVGAFGVQTNVMQEIWKLRLRTNVELLNSGIRIRGLLEDTVVALAATNQSAKIEPLLMAQTNKKVVFYFQFPAPAIDILLREGKHLTIVAISRWLIQRLPSDSLLFGENVVEIFEWLVKVGEVGWSESIQLFRTHYKELSDSLLRRILKSMPQEEMFSQIRGELSQRLKEIGTTSISSIMTQEEMFSQIQSELSQGLKETGKSSISSIATSLSGGSSSPNSIIKKYRKKCCLL